MNLLTPVTKVTNSIAELVERVWSGKRPLRKQESRTQPNMSQTDLEFKALGQRVTESQGLEPIHLPTVSTVTFTSDEVTAMCPVTGQPDWYQVNITLHGTDSIESKSLKLYLQSFRNTGIFAEHLAALILEDVRECCHPELATVRVIQKARGGITLTAEVSWDS